MNRAYSILHIKSMDSKTRSIKGTATTPTPDRMGDIIEPLGVKFKNPMPLLWQHKSSEPIGQVNFKKPTKDGIDFEASMPDVSTLPDSSKVKQRVEEAWDSLQLGLVGATSIGFKPIEYNFMKDSDGIHFVETEVFELSLVTIPANPEAVINGFKTNDGQLAFVNMIKSLDAPLLAASGLEAKDIDRPKRPGVTGKPEPEKPKAPKDARKMKIAEQISAYEAKRAAHAARMTELMTKAADQSVTLDATESEEYDRLEKEIVDIDAHLVRLNKLEEANKKLAVVVEQPKQTGGTAIILPEKARISVKGANAPPGSGFTRLCMALAYGQGDTMKSLQRAKEWEADMPEIRDILLAGISNIMDGQQITKAAVGAGTTTDSTWASPLVVYQILVDQFIELLRPRTIIGRIPNLRRVPFNIQMPATTTGTSVGWVGENAPKPVSSMAFTTVTMRWAKAAGIVILTQELVRFSNPAAEAVVRGDLIAAMAQFLDRQFIDPAVAAVPNVSPASITNGVTPIVATGTNEAALRADVKSMVQSFLVANLQTSGAVWIMTQQQALSLSLMINALGQPSFPTITGDGGTLVGYPVVASENLPASGGSPANGYPLIFALASEIMLADDGQTVIDASNQASVQMDTAPDSPPSASSPYVSLWQMNYVGLRAERWINWQKRRTNCVGYIDQAKYG